MGWPLEKVTCTHRVHLCNWVQQPWCGKSGALMHDRGSLGSSSGKLWATWHIPALSLAPGYIFPKLCEARASELRFCKLVLLTTRFLRNNRRKPSPIWTHISICRWWSHNLTHVVIQSGPCTQPPGTNEFIIYQTDDGNRGSRVVGVMVRVGGYPTRYWPCPGSNMGSHLEKSMPHCRLGLPGEQTLLPRSRRLWSPKSRGFLDPDTKLPLWPAGVSPESDPHKFT